MAEEDRLVADTPEGAVLGSALGNQQGRGDWKQTCPYPNQPRLPELLLHSLLEQLVEVFGVTGGCTFLSREHRGDRAEGPLALVVVDPDFDLVGREGQDALVPEDVFGGVRRGDHGLDPRRGPRGAEGDHVPESFPVLQLLGDGLDRRTQICEAVGMSGRREVPADSWTRCRCWHCTWQDPLSQLTLLPSTHFKRTTSRYHFCFPLSILL